jgi:hypothetical protein
VDNRTGAIAVVEVGFDSRKDIDDHWLFSEQRTVTMVVAIGTNGTASDDRARIRAVAFQEPHIDHRPHAFARQRSPLMVQDALGIGIGTSDCRTGKLHDLLGNLLGLADHFNLLSVFAASFHHPPLDVAFDSNAGPLKHFRVDHR